MTSARTRSSWTIGLVTVAACSFAPNPELPPSVVSLPDSYVSDPSSVDRDALHWWRAFNDSTLNRVVDSALAANLDIREAAARVTEIENRYRIARSPLYPNVSLSASATQQSIPANTGIGGAIGGGFGGAGFDRFEFTTYSVSLGLTYELDVWGRLRNDTRAAIRDYEATQDDLETVRLGVAATAISTYFEIRDLERQVDLARQNADVLSERSILTEDRYLRGLVSSFELYAIRQLERPVQAEVPVLETQLADARGRLAVLLGRYPSQLATVMDQHTQPLVLLSDVPRALPVAILEQRPDVRAAARRVDAARYRIGARKAELFPSITISATGGLQSSDPGTVFDIDQYFTNFVGGLLAPIFAGGRLRANVGVAAAQYEQQVAAFSRILLTAVKDVEIGLVNLTNERRRYEVLLSQRDEASASLDLQVRRFRQGVGDYLAYLDARTSFVSAERGVSDAERRLANARVTLHRALGGDWVGRPDVDSSASPTDRLP